MENKNPYIKPFGTLSSFSDSIYVLSSSNLTSTINPKYLSSSTF